MVRQAWRIERWPVTIGRALDNDVVLTDPHVAAHHATIDVAPASEQNAGQAALAVHVGETRNGLAIGRERIAGGESKSIADAGRDLDLQIGRTALRLRLPGHALAAEQVLAPRVAVERRWWPTLGLALAIIVVVLFNTYLDTDPDGLAAPSERAVLTAVSGGAIWCGIWALLSKMFARQSNFGWHVRVFVVASLARCWRSRRAAAARVLVLVAVAHRLQLRRRSRDGRRGDLLPPARGRAGAAAADARRRRRGLRRRRRPDALVQRAAHRPARARSST